MVKFVIRKVSSLTICIIFSSFREYFSKDKKYMYFSFGFHVGFIMENSSNFVMLYILVSSVERI